MNIRAAFSALKAALFSAAAMIAAPAFAQIIVINAGSVITDPDSAPTGPRTIVVKDGVITQIASLDPATRQGLRQRRTRSSIYPTKPCCPA